MVRNGPQRSQRVIVYQTFLYQQNLSKLAQNCAKISNLPFSKEVLLSKQSPIWHLLRFHENFSNFCANIVIVKYTIFPQCALTEKRISLNHLYCNFCSKTNAFTKFLGEKCEREFLQFPHTVCLRSKHSNFNTVGFLLSSIFRKKFVKQVFHYKTIL